MPKPTRHEMLALALGVLPPPPMDVEVLSEDGGAFTLKIVEQEGELLHAFAPRNLVRKELHLLARVTDEARGRYEVELEIDEAYFHSGAEALVHAAVSGVRHRKMRRSAPRIPITERAQARVLFCRSLPRHHTLDVRLSDVSTTGIGFTAAQTLDAGDLLVVSVTLAGCPVDIETRVVRVDPAPYGRSRVGCEITELREADRRLIADLALRMPEAGSEAERRNGAPVSTPASR
jgi:PilZ domain